MTGRLKSMIVLKNGKKVVVSLLAMTGKEPPCNGIQYCHCKRNDVKRGNLIMSGFCEIASSFHSSQ